MWGGDNIYIYIYVCPHMKDTSTKVSAMPGGLVCFGLMLLMALRSCNLTQCIGPDHS